MKILVTGGAGFIGSHIVDDYIKNGHRVFVIDNLSSGSKKNLNPKAKFYKADVRDASALGRIFKIEKPEVINHQAALVSVTASGKNPLETYEVNTLGTINLLIAGAPYIKKFIFASTGGAMYAKPKKFPASEEEKPTPISPYGFSKQLAEEAVIFYAKHLDFAFTILRYANVFGPRQNAHGESGVMAIFSLLASQGKKPIIYRKQTTRDYVYVGDIARANQLALSKGTSQIINIGSGKEVSNQEVYEAVAREFAWRELPTYKPARPGELLRSVLSPKKAKRLLGWQATTDVNTGLHLIHVSKN